MAKASALLFVLAVLLPHLHAGGAQQAACIRAASRVQTAVRRTGREVGGQPEYEVEFSTECQCRVGRVHASCSGVEDSAEPVDGSKVEVVEGICVLLQPLSKGSPLSFTYSSEVPVNFRVLSGATVSC